MNIKKLTPSQRAIASDAFPSVTGCRQSWATRALLIRKDALYARASFADLHARAIALDAADIARWLEDYFEL